MGGTTSGASFTFQNLPCGARDSLGVEAFDAAGNASPRATTSVQTSACQNNGMANLFVVPSGGTAGCVRSATPIPFSSSGAANRCDTFDHAYQAANAGDVVEVEAGNYAPQILGPTGGKGSAHVVIRAAANATVTLGCDDTGFNCLSTGQASHVTFAGMHTQMFTVGGAPHQGGISCERGSSDITFQDMDVGPIALACDDQTQVLGGD